MVTELQAAFVAHWHIISTVFKSKSLPTMRQCSNTHWDTGLRNIHWETDPAGAYPACWHSQEVTIAEPFNPVVFVFQGLLLSIREGTVHGWIQHVPRFPHHCHGDPVSFQVSWDKSSASGSTTAENRLEVIDSKQHFSFYTICHTTSGKQPFSLVVPLVGPTLVVIFQ